MQVKAYCEYPFTRVRITSEGKVAMCCFQRENPLGSLLNQTFDDIWFSKLVEDVRASVLEGQLHKICHCPGCPFFKGVSSPYPKKDITYNEYPTSLELDLPNTHCNVGLENPGPSHPACIMCERAAPDFKPETNHLEEVLPKLRPLMSNLKHLHIQGISEPFYKNLIFDVLDELDFDRYKTSIRVTTTTNGTLFGSQKRQRWLQRVPTSHTCFSIDAATPETFTKIRILPLFQQVIQNLNDFSKERNPRTQMLSVNNNINLLNLHEIEGMVKLAADANVDFVEFNPTDGFNETILANVQNCGKFKQAQEKMIAAAQYHKVKYYLVRPLDFGLTDKFLL